METRYKKFCFFPKNEFPALNTPVGQQIRYHIREGNHDINAYDWDQYIDFANKLVK